MLITFNIKNNENQKNVFKRSKLYKQMSSVYDYITENTKSKFYDEF